MQIVPKILSRFKISSTRLLKLQCKAKIPLRIHQKTPIQGKKSIFSNPLQVPPTVRGVPLSPHPTPRPLPSLLDSPRFQQDLSRCVQPLPRSIWKLEAYVKLRPMYIEDVEMRSHIAGTMNRNHFAIGTVAESRPFSEHRRQIQYTEKQRNSPMNIPHACQTVARSEVHTLIYFKLEAHAGFGKTEFLARWA